VLPLDFPQVYSSDKPCPFFLKVALLVPVLVFAAWFYRWIGWYYTVYIVTDSAFSRYSRRVFLSP
jgi:hypothetical protein